MAAAAAAAAACVYVAMCLRGSRRKTERLRNPAPTATHGGGGGSTMESPVMVTHVAARRRLQPRSVQWNPRQLAHSVLKYGPFRAGTNRKNDSAAHQLLLCYVASVLASTRKS
jgi:hypothetical protein